MKRRKFVLSSGCSVIGTSILSPVLNQPAVALEFELTGVPNADPRNLSSILLEFEKLELRPRYTDSKANADISLTLNIDGYDPVTNKESVQFSDKRVIDRTDLGGIAPILIDDINPDTDSLNGEIKLDIDHPSISETYRKQFIIEPDTTVDELVASEDLMAWWPLNDADNNNVSNDTATDQTGNGYDGNINNIKQGIAGRSGLQSMKFNGSNSYVRAPYFNPGTELTVSYWIKNSGNKDRFGGVVLNGDSSNVNDNMFLTGQYNGGIHVNVKGDNSELNESFAENSWEHACFVHKKDGSGSVTDIYINGTNIGSINHGTQLTGNESGGAWHLGADSDGQDVTNLSDYFDGLLCDVRVYGDPLRDDQIKSIYDRGSSNSATPPNNNNGGVSYYKFNDDADDQWSSNNGSVSGATLVDDAIRGKAFSFDGSDYINFGDNDVGEGTEKLTVNLWVKANNTESYAGIFAKDRTGGSEGDVWSFVRNNSGELEWRVKTTDNGLVSSSTSLVDNEWRMYTGVYNGSDVKLYENANLVNSSSAKGNIVSDGTELVAGSYSDKSLNITGNIDEVRIYDKELSDNEIFQLYLYGTKGKNLRKLI